MIEFFIVLAFQEDIVKIKWIQVFAVVYVMCAACDSDNSSHITGHILL